MSLNEILKIIDDDNNTKNTRLAMRVTVFMLLQLWQIISRVVCPCNHLAIFGKTFYKDMATGK